MTLRLIDYLVASGDYQITFVMPLVNRALGEALRSVRPPIRIVNFAYQSGQAQWLRTWISWRSLWRLCLLLRSLHADLLIVVQGGCTLSSLGIIAGRLAGLRTLTYIPMTHPEGTFARSAAVAAVRQAMVRPFYQLPHTLVTISERMAGYLRGRRAGPIYVVENGIPLGRPLVDAERVQMRASLGIAASDRLMAMIGRIEYGQKRHDLALEALSIARRSDQRLHLLLVGNGPDREDLAQRVRRMRLGEVVHFRDWQQDVSPYYGAADAVLLPSRYEGVPLVMLEAMYFRRKVIGADVDGMADMLPAGWRFRSGDAEDLARLMLAIDDEEDAPRLLAHHDRIVTHHTLAAFGDRFKRVVDAELRRD